MAVSVLFLLTGGLLIGQIFATESMLIGRRPDWEDGMRKKYVGSETILLDYHAYSPRLMKPDEPPSLRIRGKYPRLDGATAFYPLYAAVFQAVYAPPSQEEKSKFADAYLACSTTRKAYSLLIDGKTDIIFCLAPSAQQEQEARDKGVKLRLVPIGREAFVFFVHERNPVSDLTQVQLRDIYARTVTNWNQVGGPDLPIMPYQRPENSGSQTIMLKTVMRGTPMSAPLREELVGEMGGILNQVAEYRSEQPSIGYSFRWYVTSMEHPPLKLLAVDGVTPTVERIADNSYPLTVPFYAVVREGSVSRETQSLLDWLTGPEGQALIAKVGYVPVGKVKVPFAE